MNRDFETMKPVVDEITKRYSCRSFANKPIDDEVLDSIIEAALNAASGGNLQPVSVIVVKDQAHKDEICKLCDDQKFISDAAVNMIFCMDWNKYYHYTQYKKAPFVAGRSFAHCTIAMEDVMCMAQTVETVSYLYGIGSCYVGSVVNYIPQVSKALGLPDRVFPVVMLSLGYPKMEPKNRVVKLKRDMIFCDEYYTNYSDEQIAEAYDEKLSGRYIALPKNEEAANQMIETFRACMLTTYTAEETEAVIEEIKAAGKFNETQRRFGLHYPAAEMLTCGEEMMQGLKDRQMNIFDQK